MGCLLVQDPLFLKSVVLDSIVTARLPLASITPDATITTASGKVLPVTQVSGAATGGGLVHGCEGFATRAYDDLLHFIPGRKLQR